MRLITVYVICLINNRSYGWSKNKLTSNFKQLTKNEIEVEESLATQLSRNSRMVSIESARTLSTLSSAVMSVIDLTDLSSEFQPALKAISVDYESDNDPEYIVSDDLL